MSQIEQELLQEYAECSGPLTEVDEALLGEYAMFDGLSDREFEFMRHGEVDLSADSELEWIRFCIENCSEEECIQMILDKEGSKVENLSEAEMKELLGEW